MAFCFNGHTDNVRDQKENVSVRYPKVYTVYMECCESESSFDYQLKVQGKVFNPRVQYTTS